MDPPTPPNPFPWRCFRCGLPGHRASDCGDPSPNAEGRAVYDAYQRRRDELQELAKVDGASASASAARRRERRKDGLRHLRKMQRWMEGAGGNVRDPVEYVAERNREGGGGGSGEMSNDLRESYRELFKLLMTAMQSELEGRLFTSPDKRDPMWRQALNAAVKEGEPADFSDGGALRAYAVNKLETRCRYLYLTVMDDNPISAGVRRMLLPAGRDGGGVGNGGGAGRAVRVCSLGGGPGYDHVALSLAARYLAEVQRPARPPPDGGPPPSPGARRRPPGGAAAPVTTRVFDLYDSDWRPVADEVLGCLRGAAGGGGGGGRGAPPPRGGGAATVHHADLRLPLDAPGNEDLRDAVPLADVICFQFVLHENASSLLVGGGGGDGHGHGHGEGGGRARIGGAVGDVLCRARVGAAALCADSCNLVWPALRATAEAAGWRCWGDSDLAGGRRRMALGPRSFVLLERTSGGET